MDARHVLRYLSGTAPLGIRFKKNSKNGRVRLIWYSDSDFGGDCDERKSISAYVFILAGAAKRKNICWGSKKRGLNAQSTVEAE